MHEHLYETVASCFPQQYNKSIEACQEEYAMEQQTLFGNTDTQPLAARLRPQSLDDLLDKPTCSVKVRFCVV